MAAEGSSRTSLAQDTKLSFVAFYPGTAEMYR
ncbi:hypothetical protein ABID26_001365 [Mesorhizobium shonense]|uniref:Uncharacterized protein n=1 Tax=Mesorhizobium shonense TaxID=1209948 RepID=A0ABV2HN30_9HYPH